MDRRKSSILRCVVLLGVSAVLLLASGCGVRKIPMPAHTTPPNLSISPNEKLQPVSFDKLVIDMDRGTLMGAAWSGYADVKSAICNYHTSHEIYWNGGKGMMDGAMGEAAEVFYEALTSEGYNVVGDPEAMYRHEYDLGKATYTVAARITDLKVNVCLYSDIWVGRFLGGIGEAEVAITVEWTVYDSIKEEVVLEVVTTGYQPADRSVDEPAVVALLDALHGAAQGLANNQKFHELIAKKPEYRNVASIKAETIGDAEGGTLILPYVPESQIPLAEDPERAQKSTVLLRKPGGHGSGFVVSKDGYIITNAHVVGESDTVNVEFFGGFGMQGKVLRRHKTRDVALVKVNVSKALPFPLRTAKADVMETVYAVGAPTDPELGWSVTRGTVSAYRKNKKTGLISLQSDVEVHGGNSGGPLLDEDGNVVALCVAGRISNDFGVGLNFFIPIKDALKKLDIRIGADDGTEVYNVDGGRY